VKASCEHGDEPSDSIKRLDVLEYLHNWQLSLYLNYVNGA
jgi:hypothetical protein